MRVYFKEENSDRVKHPKIEENYFVFMSIGIALLFILQGLI